MYAKIDICWINKHHKYIILPSEITTSSFDKSWSAKVLKYSSGVAITYIKHKHRQTNQIVRSRKNVDLHLEDERLWWSCCLIKSWGRRSFLGICRQLVYLRKLRIVCAQKNGPSLDSAAGWKNFGQNWQLTSKLARLQDSKTPLSRASRLHFVMEQSVE